MGKSIKDLQIEKLRLDARILKLRADDFTGLEKERLLVMSKIKHLEAKVMEER